MEPKEVVIITGTNHQPITVDITRLVSLLERPYGMIKTSLTVKDLAKIPQFSGIKLENEAFQYSWIS